MDIDIKIGTQTELRQWLHRQKKNGNAVQYVAVEDPRTNQRVMLVWKDADLKVCRPSPSSSIEEDLIVQSGSSSSAGAVEKSTGGKTVSFVVAGERVYTAQWVDELLRYQDEHARRNRKRGVEAVILSIIAVGISIFNLWH